MNRFMKTDPIDQLDALIDARKRGEPLTGATPAGARHAFPILCALTDDKFAPAVLRMAHALERDRGASPTLVEVAEVALHAGWDASGTVSAVAEDLFGPAFQQECVRAMRMRHRGEHGIPGAWPVEIRVGDIAACIEASARNVHAELIVLGLHRHGRIARAIGDDTTHEVMRASTVPVLALRPGLAALPKRVVVAMDFSMASLRAARLARQIMDDRGVMYLVHVRSGFATDETEQTEGIRLVQTAGIDAAFRHVTDELAAPSGMTISCVTLTGNPVTELELLADGSQAELIAIGSQRHNWLDRLLLGSVASAIVRDARWSVLVTPPSSRVPAPPSVRSGSVPPGGFVA